MATDNLEQFNLFHLQERNFADVRDVFERKGYDKGKAEQAATSYIRNEFVEAAEAFSNRPYKLLSSLGAIATNLTFCTLIANYLTVANISKETVLAGFATSAVLFYFGVVQRYQFPADIIERQFYEPENGMFPLRDAAGHSKAYERAEKKIQAFIQRAQPGG